MSDDPLSRPQLLAAIERWERQIRMIASATTGGIPAPVRKDLLDIANAMLRALGFEPPPSSQ